MKITITSFLAAAVVVTIVGLLVPHANPQSPAKSSPAAPGQSKVSWSPNAITIFLLPGDIRMRTVVLSNVGAIKNASLEPVPEIAKLLNLTPTTIPALSPNQSIVVRLEAALTAGTTSGTYSGTIHLREGSKTIPQPLPVNITVGLPPDPGNLGKQSLAGIDSDGDGVRDDVQRYIGLTYPQSAKQRAALNQAAQALQAEVLGASSARQQIKSAIGCESYTFMKGAADMAGGLVASNAWHSLKAVILNTADRIKIDAQASSQAGPAIDPMTPYSQQAGQCLISPSSFSN